MNSITKLRSVIDIFELDTMTGQELNAPVASNEQQGNACTARICRLPPELISEIFLTVQQVALDEFLQRPMFYLDDIFPHLNPCRYENSGYTPDKDWIHLMSTCSTLRSVALGTPELWQHMGVPVSGNAKWRDLCVTRAQGRQPHIYTPPTRVGGNNVLEITALLPQAKEAHLVAELTWTKGSKLIDHLCQPCASLQTLSLFSKTYDLTSSFFGGRCATLTTLILSVREIASWPQFPNLRCLKLLQRRAPYDGDGRTLLAWLDQLPTLEVLSITLPELASSDYFPPYHTSLRVDLPVLHILHIDADMENAHSLLELLIASDSKTLLNISIVNKRSFNLSRSHDHSIRKAYKDLLECFNEYVNIHGTTSLRANVTCSYDQSDSLIYLEWYMPHILSAKGRPAIKGPGAEFRPFCTFTGPHDAYCTNQFLGNVRTLRLVGGLADNAKHHDFRQVPRTPYPDTELMTQLDTVIEENTSSIQHVYLLEKWLRRRKRPIRLLRVGYPATVPAKIALRDMIVGLEDDGIVASVECSWA